MKQKGGTALALLLMLMLLLCACGRMEKPTVTEEEPTAHVAGRSWYGYFTVDAAEGYYAEVVGRRLDCTGETDGENMLTLRIAALDGDEYLGRIRLSAAGDECLGGEMIDRELASDDCSVVTDGDGMTLSGSYRSKDGGSFAYTIRLRPWGETWDGDKDELPDGYFDWYLPLIRDGKPMPDTLGD